MFCGSVNPREFLHDATGNRRFWTIECQHINHDHGLDMQQVWAEVYALWKSGEGYYLTADEMDALNAHNTDFMAADPVEERLLDWLDWNTPTTLWRWTQVSTVLIECGIDRPTKADSAVANTLIRAKNGDQFRRSNGQRMVLCPPKAFRK
jgi:putative DNA primase/helicase